MSLDTIPNRSNGRVIDQTWWNLLRAVLSQSLFPRNLSGVVQSEVGNLGDSINHWKDIFVRSVVLARLGNAVKINSDGSYSIVFPSALPINGQKISIAPSGELSFADIAAPSNYVFTASSGSAVFNSVGTFQVPNLSAQITTKGGVIGIRTVHDNTGTLGVWGLNNISGSSGAIEIRRNGVTISKAEVSVVTAVPNPILFPTSAINFIDQPEAGTHTYEIFATLDSAGSLKSISFSNAKLFVYEV